MSFANGCLIDLNILVISLFQVLEIGGGSGTNFNFVKTPVNWVVVEPNKDFAPYFDENVQKSEIKHKVRGIVEVTLGFIFMYLRMTFSDFSFSFQCFGENLNAFEDNSMDAIVETLVLCSVEDVSKCLEEFHRVLKPGGKLFLLDHEVSETGTFTRWSQWILTHTFWKFFCGNCRLDRDLRKYLKNSKFDLEIIPFDFKMPFVLRSAYYAVATKQL